MDTQLTGVGGTHAPALQEVLDGLNDLLQLDHDAIAAYDVAIAKLEDRDHADQIAGYRRDHERHVRELNELVARLGGTPANHPHVTGPFKTALQSLGALAGDRGLLMAFRTNELAVRTRYDAYASRAMLWPHDVKRTIDGAALDEERHYAWVADVLQRMGVGSGEPDGATRAADLAREQANVGAGVVSHAKEAVAEAADAVTGAVSGAAGSVKSAVGGVADKVGDTVSGVAESVTGAVSGAAGAVGERVSGLAGSVREGVTGGVGAVRNRIAGLVDTAEDSLESVGGRVQNAAGGVRSAATGAADTFEGRVREKPLQTLLLAGVAGFV
ncbi:MAG TPA: DUF2383 domain-containing protein, partial [Longimicrobium sp.]|nr:DUF2383 domain-containing protein [Longimicrobium sp.]